MPTAELSLRQQFQTLYSTHHEWLLGWLRRRLGCPHQAADMAQNTFLRVLAARDALGGVEQPRAWLATTAKRLLIDEARRRRIEQRYLDELTRQASQIDGYPSPEAILTAVQAMIQLDEVLQRVSSNARGAFIRHYLDGETHATVAQELGVSPRMVRKYLAQVLLEARKRELNAW